MIGPSDLMEAADLADQGSKKLGQGVFKPVFVLDLENKNS